MSKYLDVLIATILLSLLITTLILPINYFTTTISDLGFFMETLILHNVLSVAIFLGGTITMMWWSIKKKSIQGWVFITILAIFGITLLPIFEWMAFWMLCGWAIMRLIKNDKNDKKD